MKTLRFSVLLSVVLPAALYCSWGTSTASAKEDWIILNARHDGLTPGSPHGLKNASNGRMLVIKRQPRGIYLGWEPPSHFDGTFTFQKRRKSNADIVYGEPVAITLQWGGEKFLHYETSNLGIELTFSRTPSYEWVFTGGDRGTPVRPWVQKSGKIRDISIGLYNTRRNAWLVYGARRDGGVALRWHARVRANGGPSGTCTIVVEAAGRYSKDAKDVGVFEFSAGRQGRFLSKHAFKRVRDHRQGQQAQIRTQSRFSMSAGTYVIAPRGGGTDRLGSFGILFKPSTKQIRCTPGKTHRLAFIADSAEY